MIKSFVVFGIGRLGSTVARTLFDLQNEVLAIDINAEKVRNISEDVTTAIQADITDGEVLEDIGLKNFDVAIIAIGTNLESAIMATMACVEAEIPLIVAKAPTKRYGRILRKLGAHKIIYPEMDMGVRLAQKLTDDGILDFFELSEDYGIVEYRIPDSWVGDTIRDLEVRNQYHINVIALRRNEDLIVQNISKEPLRKEDIIIFFGSSEDLGAMKALYDESN
ncbi:Ktr system potassium uptake protein A [Aedoeadaptatus ivorii]|uniref:Ktr system potassium uptake protein A n=1 Tax=Aedoeadaptatus ivorii TaxID=54006 RepID=A0A3S4ZQR2_9FIRM|nr:TrkA family potassium uptake protein [Peptoniphilus ivorii]MDQ0508914.1 trk system potassium uptake protein TrkA [Peptoniphilus ivorii]VEJ35740.1 Ktr system potassium uptake protein A [Peptoniphilus ivorii]